MVLHLPSLMVLNPLFWTISWGHLLTSFSTKTFNPPKTSPWDQLVFISNSDFRPQKNLSKPYFNVFSQIFKKWPHNFWIWKPRKLFRAYLLSWTENEPQMSDTTSDTVLMIMYLSTFHKMKYQISHQKIAINSREFEIDKHESPLKSRIFNRIFYLSSIIEQ